MNKQEIIEFIDDSICRTYENLRSSDIDNAEEQVALNNSLMELKLIKKYLYQLDEPERPEKEELPYYIVEYLDARGKNENFVLKELYLELFARDYGHFYSTSDIVLDWINISGNATRIIDATRNGYKPYKKPMWVVKSAQGSGYLIDYKLRTDSEILNASKNNAYQFEDKQRAEAVATLVGGTVEEWSE